MRHVTISLHHKDCWCTDVTEKFPNLKLKFLTPYSIIERTREYIKSRGMWAIIAPDEKTLNKAINFLRNHRQVIDIEIVKIFLSRAIVFMRWKVHSSPYEVACHHGFVPIESMTAENGIEIYNFVAEDEKTIKKAFDAIRKVTNFNILKIGKLKKGSDRFNITERQREALQIAFLYGYYSWPRSVTLEELAKVMKVSRRVFQEHLRKAESRLFPEFIGEVIGHIN